MNWRKLEEKLFNAFAYPAGYGSSIMAKPVRNSRHHFI